MTGVNRMVRSAALAAKTFTVVVKQQAPKLHKPPKPWNQRWAEGGRRKAMDAQVYFQSIRDSFKYPTIEDDFPDAVPGH